MKILTIAAAILGWSIGTWLFFELVPEDNRHHYPNRQYSPQDLERWRLDP